MRSLSLYLKGREKEKLKINNPRTFHCISFKDLTFCVKFSKFIWLPSRSILLSLSEPSILGLLQLKIKVVPSLKQELKHTFPREKKSVHFKPPVTHASKYLALSFPLNFSLKF